MDVKISLISMSISVALLGGVWGPAAAKQAQEEDSVYQWGRWAVLAPAAGQEEVIALAPAVFNDLGPCESSANCRDPNRPEDPPVQPPEEPPVEPPVSEAEPVGYARIDYRERGSNQVFTRYVGGFELYLDGSAADSEEDPESLGYIVTGPSAPDGDTVTLDSGLLPVAVDAAGFRSTARGNNSFSGRFTYGADDEVAVIQGPWRQIAADGSHAHSGEYVFGITATGVEMTALMEQLDSRVLGSDIFAQYSGPTATGGAIALEFNLTRDTWQGTVHGNVVDFDASGTLSNARFVANDFSDNITSGEMEGALVNAGHNAIGSFAVESDRGEGGLLREADIFNAELSTAGPSVEVAAQ